MFVSIELPKLDLLLRRWVFLPLALPKPKAHILQSAHPKAIRLFVPYARNGVTGSTATYAAAQSRATHVNFVPYVRVRSFPSRQTRNVPGNLAAIALRWIGAKGAFFSTRHHRIFRNIYHLHSDRMRTGRSGHSLAKGYRKRGYRVSAYCPEACAHRADRLLSVANSTAHLSSCGTIHRCIGVHFSSSFSPIYAPRVGRNYKG